MAANSGWLSSSLQTGQTADTHDTVQGECEKVTGSTAYTCCCCHKGEQQAAVLDMSVHPGDIDDLM
jgi:hypothetical protein